MLHISLVLYSNYLYKTRNWFQCHEYGPEHWKVGSFGLISEEVAEWHEDIYLLCNTNLVCVSLWVKLRSEMKLALTLYKSREHWRERWWIIWGKEAKASLGTRARRPHCLACPVSSAMMFLWLMEVEPLRILTVGYESPKQQLPHAGLVADK